MDCLEKVAVLALTGCCFKCLVYFHDFNVGLWGGECVARRFCCTGLTKVLCPIPTGLAMNSFPICCLHLCNSLTYFLVVIAIELAEFGYFCLHCGSCVFRLGFDCILFTQCNKVFLKVDRVGF